MERESIPSEESKKNRFGELSESALLHGHKKSGAKKTRPVVPSSAAIFKNVL